MLQLKQYVALLKTGVAEVGAYRTLFPDVKATVFPIFQARPWPHANHFSLTIDRIREATAGQPFGFALDAQRRAHPNPREAQSEFDDLFESHQGHRHFYETVDSIPGAVPVLIPPTSPDNLLLQIGNAADLDRGLIIHQRRGSAIPLSDLILGLPPLPHDTVIVVDAGWSRDYLALEAWSLPTLERILVALPNSEIVVMSSSFPDSFSHIVGNMEEMAMERRLFAAMRQRFQQADLTYGDWASTRPPLSGGGGNIPSRIDVPKISSWEIFRADPDNDPGFSEMAWEAQHHPCFASTPDSWGKQTIAATTDFPGTGVTGLQVATQARVNIHMTIQSGATSILPTDEAPYED
ncbi:beta family protein [Sphingomonas sp. PWP1-2]|uniref:beta family protein n=1 Tax=Sphingomonas sp. PWP1-2 TaxID=2804558 RepID=UPI003CF2C278